MMLKSVSSRILQRIENRLHFLYGDQAHGLANRLYMMIGRYGVGINGHTPAAPGWGEQDVVLITYGDMIHAPEEAPLATLKRVLDERMSGMVNTVHILPFFPYSSDDGFSVKDYYAVDPALGTWRDVEHFRDGYALMFDLVINHVSRQSQWFRDYVSDIAPYRHFFLEMDPATDLSAVVRPRNLPLLSETQTRRGKRHVWTTFSPDQVDLNFANPDVLFEMLDILMWYIAKGARIIRLDAIAFLWKIPGTPCVHLTQTHEVVKLLRDFIPMIAPEVLLLTETNVPHEENISYFGNGDEAHMVYQFSLPPLLAHGLLTQYAGHVTHWAERLPVLNEDQAFFNFTASHDGVGVRPLTGLIDDKAFDALIDHVHRMGGRVSFKRNADGTESPYELNITYFDLLGENPAMVTDTQIARFLSSQAIMLAMRGIPGIYFNSLFGARNDQDGVNRTGQSRSINRQKWSESEWLGMINDPQHHAHRVFAAYQQMLRIRRAHRAFHPSGPQRVLRILDTLFALERTAPDSSEVILHLTNFAAAPTTIDWPVAGLNWPPAASAQDLLTDRVCGLSDGSLTLAPYQSVWLTPVSA